MNSRNFLTRRIVLKAIFFGTMAATLGGRLCWRLGPPSDASRAMAKGLTRGLARDNALVELGARYLLDTPEERGIPYLAERIAERWPSGRIELGRLSSAELHEAILRIVKSDLANGDVVIVGGWVLSISEARLYGLANLLTK